MSTDAFAILRTSLESRGEKLVGRLREARKKPEEELIHDLRVASRRLDSCLSILALVLGRGKLRDVQSDLRRIRKATGGLRDLHIILSHLQESELSEEHRTSLETARERDERKRLKASRRSLRGVRPKPLAGRLRKVGKSLQRAFRDPDSEQGFVELLESSVHRAFRRVLKTRDGMDPADSASL
ncbi:MAG: CHAD domain-containing protein, partial [Candidatus Eremiobacterota bacterium]